MHCIAINVWNSFCCFLFDVGLPFVLHMPYFPQTILFWLFWYWLRMPQPNTVRFGIYWRIQQALWDQWLNNYEIKFRLHAKKCLDFVLLSSFSIYKMFSLQSFQFRKNNFNRLVKKEFDLLFSRKSLAASSYIAINLVMVIFISISLSI